MLVVLNDVVSDNAVVQKLRQGDFVSYIDMYVRKASCLPIS